MKSRSNIDAAVDEGRALQIDGDPRWHLAQKIAGSRQFARSARLRELLLHVCRAALEHHPEELSELQIGAALFGRAPGYNAGEDSIVRSQARLLRQKLDAYFAEEGAGESTILRIPKGSYVPEFVERLPAAQIPNRTGTVNRWLAWSTGLLAMTVAAMALVMVGNRTAKEFANAGDGLWPQLLNGKMPVTVVAPDHTSAMIQEVVGEQQNLAAYMQKTPPSANQRLGALEEALPKFAMRRYTSFDAVIAAVRIAQLTQRYPAKLVVRYARDVSIQDLTHGNAVLIGRPVSNRWTELFQAKQNFQFYSDLAHHLVICRNVMPRPGEQAEYAPLENGGTRVVYASIAFVPNLNQSGNVLLIGGTSSGSQDSAVEFLTNDKMMAQFAAKLGSTGGNLPHFDVLLRTRTINGLGQEPEVIAWRDLGR